MILFYLALGTPNLSMLIFLLQYHRHNTETIDIILDEHIVLTNDGEI